MNSEIAEKERLAQQLWAAAGKIDDEIHIGTALNEVDVPEHSCFILGNLLGHPEAVSHLEVKYQPDLETKTAENAFELRVMHNSLSNFAGVARHLLTQSTDQLKLQFNLDCAGKLGIAKRHFSQEGIATFYTLEQDGKIVQVLGNIEQGFAQRLIDAVEANPGVEEVALGSGGGSVGEALRAGTYIRHKRLGTRLWNDCLSACPLVLLGGVNRTNWSPYADLGFHQIRTPDGVAIPLDDPTYRIIFDYSIRMGADPRYVLKQMWAATPEDMKFVEGSSEELCDAGVLTWVQRGCSAPQR